MKGCNCTPPVEDPRFEAHIMTGGIGIWSRGHTIEEAVENVRRHAKRDRIAKRDWVDCWVHRLADGVEVWVDGFSRAGLLGVEAKS